MYRWEGEKPFVFIFFEQSVTVCGSSNSVKVLDMNMAHSLKILNEIIIFLSLKKSSHKLLLKLYSQLTNNA